MKLPKSSAFGRQEKALAFVPKCGFSGEKIADIFYFCIEKGGTRNRKKIPGERESSGPASSKTNRLQGRQGDGEGVR